MVYSIQRCPYATFLHVTKKNRCLSNLAIYPAYVLDESFAPETVHNVPDSFVKGSETNTQTDQFLGRIL